MRRLVAVVAVVAFVLALAGCGGSSSSDSTSTTSASAGAAAPVAVGVAPALSAVPNRSANVTGTFEPFPTGPDVPADLKQKITVENQPTLIYFYDSTQDSSKEVRSIIDDVRDDNRGLVDLVAYDIGKYLTTDPTGAVSADPKLTGDAQAAGAVKLARDSAIGVAFTPFIVLTDGQGQIIYKHQGLVDHAFLEREVLRAAR